MFVEQPLASPWSANDGGDCKTSPATQGLLNRLAKTSLNLDGHQNCITGSKSIAILMDGGDFAYWWSCIGEGLRLQPVQQDCLITLKSFGNG